ncbi:hypothetical protein ACO2Q9_14080 [Variovorax sp. VNK109]
MRSNRFSPRNASRPLVLAAALLWGAVELVALQRHRWRHARNR